MGVSEDAAAVVATGTEINEVVQDYMKRLKQSGDNAIVAVEAAFQNRINTLIFTAYVNKTTGSDENTGVSETSALKTINKALEKTPMGGLCIIHLCDDYHVTKTIPVVNRKLKIANGSGIRHRLTFQMTREENQTPGGKAKCEGIRLEFGSYLSIQGVTIVQPSKIGQWAGSENAEISYHSSPFYSDHHSDLSSIKIHYCDVEFADEPFSGLIGVLSPVALRFYANIMTAADYHGRLFWRVKNRSGTPTTSIPYVISELPTV